MDRQSFDKKKSANYLSMEGMWKFNFVKDHNKRPANTYIATILSITSVGLVPILVEPNPETLQIDENLIESNISYKTRGIMLVHLYGKFAWTERIQEICKENDLLIFEDNAQAFGCGYVNSSWSMS